MCIIIFVLSVYIWIGFQNNKHVEIQTWLALAVLISLFICVLVAICVLIVTFRNDKKEKIELE